jgi:hypothetical protein
LKGGDSPIFKNWLGDLDIFYVADAGNNFQILLERDLPKDISKGELHHLGVDNLNRDIEFKLQKTNFGEHRLVAGGDHEAGSICLPVFAGLADRKSYRQLNCCHSSQGPCYNCS